MSGGSWRRGRALALPSALVVGGLLGVGGAGGQQVEVIPLPEPRVVGSVSVERALAERRSIRAYHSDTISLGDAAQLLWAAQGVTLPSADGDTGPSLRTAPSAGSRYPLETYLVAGLVRGLETGLYRYLPEEHALVAVLQGDHRAGLADAAIGQRAVQEAPAAIVLAAVYARMEGRYGGRAQRYVHMEVGVAAQNVALQAVALGLGSVYVGAFRDDAVRTLLELPDDQAPLALLPFGRAP